MQRVTTFARSETLESRAWRIAGVREWVALLAPWLVLVLSGVYCALISPWYFTSRPIADGGVTISPAWRILLGQLPYRDFFLFIGPVSPFATAGWFAVLGHGALGMISLSLALGVAVALLTYWLARSVAPPELAVPAALGSVALGQLFWFTVSYHWFATALLLGASVALVRGLQTPRAGWLALAGVCCALAGLSHQPRGALGLVGVLLAVLLLWPGRGRARALAAVIGGTAVAALAVLVPLALAVGPVELFYSLVWFPLFDYPQANLVPYLAFDLVPAGFTASPLWGALQAVIAFGALAVAPLAFPLLALVAWRRRGRGLGPVTRAAGAIAITGGLAWLAVMYQPSGVHLGFAVPWALAAWAALLGIGLQASRTAFRRQARLACPVLALALLAMLPIPQAWTLLTTPLVWIDSPSGSVPLGTAYDAEEYSASVPEISDFILAHTRPGEPVMFFPYRSVLNVLLERPNPTRFDYLSAGENRDADIQAVMDDLTERHVAAYVVIDADRADAMARVAVERGWTTSGVRALRQLRTNLPLELQTARVEIRDGRDPGR